MSTFDLLYYAVALLSRPDVQVMLWDILDAGRSLALDLEAFSASYDILRLATTFLVVLAILALAAVFIAHRIFPRRTAAHHR